MFDQREFDATVCFDRLGEVVAIGGAARALHDKILAAVDHFAGGEPALDDQSLVVVERH